MSSPSASNQAALRTPRDQAPVSTPMAWRPIRGAVPATTWPCTTQVPSRRATRPKSGCPQSSVSSICRSTGRRGSAPAWTAARAPSRQASGRPASQSRRPGGERLAKRRGEVGRIARRREAEGGERRPAAMAQPRAAGLGRGEEVEQHAFVIAHEAGGPAGPVEGPERVEHPRALGAAVDHVAQGDDPRPPGAGPRGDRVEQAREQVVASVDVADEADRRVRAGQGGGPGAGAPEARGSPERSAQGVGGAVAGVQPGRDSACGASRRERASVAPSSTPAMPKTG